MKNFQVDLTYFQRNKDAWVQCKVTFHLQAENVHEALFSAVLLLEGVSFSDIEDARIEKEGYYVGNRQICLKLSKGGKCEKLSSGFDVLSA